MRKASTKLNLSRETLRNLEERALVRAAGQTPLTMQQNQLSASCDFCYTSVGCQTDTSCGLNFCYQSVAGDCQITV